MASLQAIYYPAIKQQAIVQYQGCEIYKAYITIMQSAYGKKLGQHSHIFRNAA